MEIGFREKEEKLFLSVKIYTLPFGIDLHITVSDLLKVQQKLYIINLFLIPVITGKQVLDKMKTAVCRKQKILLYKQICSCKLIKFDQHIDSLFKILQFPSPEYCTFGIYILKFWSLRSNYIYISFNDIPICLRNRLQ